MNKSTKAKLARKSNEIKVEREDPRAIDLREYRFIPKLKITKKSNRPAYDKLFPGIG